jgi:protocatechuate 3,4-dioxygenase beta subunit
MHGQWKAQRIAIVFMVMAGISGLYFGGQIPQVATAKQKDCRIEGTVVSAATGIPLKAARITLDMQDQHLSFKESTDADGHFIFASVPAGKYRFRASKSGYVTEGLRLDHGPPRETLELEPGDTLNKVQFRLTRAGVIKGRITDETGEPVAGVEMEALVAITKDDPLATDDDAPQALGKFAVTNDLGEYRIYDLPPGNYYVVATDSGFADYMSTPGPLFLRRANHAALYYPGVTRKSEARRIRIKAGQESRIDLSLKPEKTVRVSGRVLDPDGNPAPHVTVTLDQQDPDPNFWLRPDYSSPTDAQGNFEITEVLPNSYRLSSTLQPLNAAGEAKQYWAEQQVEVAGANVSGIELRLSESVNLSGKVTATGGAKLDFHDLKVDLTAEGGRYLGAFAEMKKDGTFTIYAARRTMHGLKLTGLPDGWYVRSAFFDDQNVLEDGLQLAGADTNKTLQIIVSRGAAEVEGLVLQGDHPVPEAVVKLIPEPAKPHRTDLLRIVTTNEEGYFVMNNVVPGKYLALALRSEHDYENDDDDSAQAQSTALSIVLAEGESKAVQLTFAKDHD